MNASKSSTDPAKCVKAAKLEQAECKGSVNATQRSVNAIDGRGNLRRGLVNARRRSDECRLGRSKSTQLSPTTAVAPRNRNKPGDQTFCIVIKFIFIYKTNKER